MEKTGNYQVLEQSQKGNEMIPVNFLEGIGERMSKPELKKYKVKVESRITGYIDVEAIDEDDAEDRAEYVGVDEVEWSEPKEMDYVEVSEC